MEGGKDEGGQEDARRLGIAEVDVLGAFVLTAGLSPTMASGRRIHASIVPSSVPLTR